MYSKVSNHIRILIMLAVIAAIPQMVVTSQSRRRNLAITPLSWSSDGNSVAITLGNLVELHDARNGHLLYTLKDHKADVTRVAWNPDNTIIATASLDQSVKLWRASDGSLLRTLTGHNNEVVFVGWTPDGKHVASSAYDAKPNFFIWDIQTGEPIARYLTGTPEAGAYSPDGQKFALVIGGDLAIYSSATFERIALYREKTTCCSNTMWSLGWGSDGTLLVTGSGNGLVTVWSSDNATVKTQFMINAYANPDALAVKDAALAWVRDVRFNDDGTTVIAIAGDGTLKEWNIQTGTVLQDMKLPALATASWSPYGARLAVLDASFLPALDGTPSQKQSADTGFQVTVPNPTVARLNRLVAVCARKGNTSQAAVQALTTKAVTKETLATFDTQIKALPIGAIPAACQADLLAMSAALQNP